MNHGLKKEGGVELDLSTWLTDAEVCARLGVSQDTLDRLVKKGLQAAKRPMPGRKPQRVFDPELIAARMPPAPAKVLTAPIPAISAPSRELRESPHQNGLVADQSMMMISHLIDVAVAARIEIAARKEPEPDPTFITLQRAAEITGLSVPRIRNIIDKDGLDGVYDKRRSIKVRREDLADMDFTSEQVKPGSLGAKKKRKAKR